MPYDLTDKEISKLKLETNPSYYDGYTKVIVAKQNDVNSRLLCVDIFSSGERVDISKYSTRLNIKMPNNKHYAVNGQMIDGNLYFKIYDSMLKEIGHISCDVSLYKECINVVSDTYGSINYTDVIVEQDTFITKVEELGSYIFEYNGTNWILNDADVVLSDYGIALNNNAELFSGDKIIVSYSNYVLLTTETFFIVVQENINSEDADIPVDSEGKVFEYINADDVLVAIEQTHIHNNKEILDNTTAIYTREDKTKLTNIDTTLYVEKSVLGKSNGVATLDSIGLIPSKQLPSFVDDVIECYTTGESTLSEPWLSLTDNGEALSPEKGKIYVIISDGEFKNKQYRWSGSTYVLCNPSDVNSVNGKTGIVNLILDDIPDGDIYKKSHNDFTNLLKEKLEGIEEGAEKNVQPDWEQKDSTSKDYIKNKPLIPEGVKLYSSTGENEDGAMTQKATTEVINNNPALLFAESERQKSKNLFNSENVPIKSNYLEYDKETNSFIYTVNETIESSQTSFVILKYGNLNPGTYTMSFDITSTIGNTAPVIVAELNEYDNFDSSIASKNIIDGYVYLTFTLTEEKNIGLAWYYKAGWIEGDAAAGVKTLTNLQLEKGSVATDNQIYNGAIAHKNDIPTTLDYYTTFSTDSLNSESSFIFKDSVTGLYKRSNFQNFMDSFIKSNYLPLTGSNMTGAITFSNFAYSNTEIPTALSYGRLQSYGTLKINGNTDNSGTEYVLITSGHGCSDSVNDGLAIGADALTWKGNSIALKSELPEGDVYTTLTVIDATSLDENTYYPVTFDAARKRLKVMIYNQWNGGNPTWSTHNSKNYSTVKIWEASGYGWGENNINRIIYNSSYNWASVDPVRGIGQMGNSSTEYVFVRGGGKYNIYTSHNVVPTLRTDSYTVSSQTIAPTTTAPASIEETIATRDTEQTITANKTFSGTITITGTLDLIV